MHAPTILLDPETGDPGSPHRVNPFTGKYKGRTYKVIAKKS